MVAVRALGAMLQVLIFAAVLGAIAVGVGRIVADWRQRFRLLDREAAERRRARDLEERGRPDVVALRRDPDGVYRPDDAGRS